MPQKIAFFTSTLTLISVLAIRFDAHPPHESNGPLEELKWLAGTWVGEVDGTQMEEHWMVPKGGLMLGLHRDVNSAKPTFFEYLRIEVTADGIDYVASPSGQGATRFRLVESSEDEVIFENLKHDFPQRILYAVDEETLTARIEGNVNGEQMSQEWEFTKLTSK